MSTKSRRFAILVILALVSVSLSWGGALMLAEANEANKKCMPGLNPCPACEGDAWYGCSVTLDPGFTIGECAIANPPPSTGCLESSVKCGVSRYCRTGELTPVNLCSNLSIDVNLCRQQSPPTPGPTPGPDEYRHQ